MAGQRGMVSGARALWVAAAFLACPGVLAAMPAGTPESARPSAPVAPGAQAARADTLERHPLELRALVEPEAVLQELTPAILDAKLGEDHHTLALLYLAQANACRVIADWACQREAGIAAAEAAKAAGLPHLQVRGLIAESRGRIAVQDFTRGERLLGDAELILKASPQRELLADVYLAYSSMSFSLGKHALAAEYADRGLAVLAEGEALTMQARLLRNRARAQAQLGMTEEAGASLVAATAVTERLKDPKLSAELYLEAARMARISGDHATQVRNGERVLALAEQLKNSQLAGLGHEVLGLAAADQGDGATADRELRESMRQFRQLELDSDELRVLRELITVLNRHDPSGRSLPPLVGRFLSLDRALEMRERAQASDDFDARLQYAEREMEVMRLQGESALAQEREQALAQTNQMSRVVMGLGLATLMVLAAFFVAQRRNNRKLQSLLARLSESEALYRTLADNASDLVVRMRVDGTVLYVSPSSREMLGYEPAEMMLPRWDVVHPDDVDRLRSAMAQLGEQGGSLTITYRAQHRGGYYVWIEVLARRVEQPDGSLEILFTGRDISTRMRAEQALAATQARLRAVTDNIPALIAHVDTQERYSFVNAYGSKVFGGDTTAMVGRTVREVRGEAIYSEIRDQIRAALRGERVTFEGQTEISGRTYHYQTSYVPDVGPDGALQGFFSFTFDITQIKLAEQALERLARIDSLTDLANRRYFDERLGATLAQCRRQHAPVALLYLDIDHFKAINDSRGHAAGDLVIKEFARRLKACVREGDLVARIGGDEFIVLIEGAGTTPAAAETMARKLIQQMEQPIAVPNASLQVTTSIGIGFSRASRQSDRLLAAADEALYAAKAGGRNTWRVVEVE